MRRNLNWITAVTLALGLLAGCGGGSGTPPNITAAGGGTVTSADGRVTLTVPPGAAPRGMTLRIVNTSPAVPADVGVLAGYGYALEGDGGALGADAELSITIDTASAPATAADRRHALGGSVAPPSPPPVNCPEGTIKTATPNGGVTCEVWPPEPAVLTTSGLAKLDRCRFLPANLRLICSMREVLPKTIVLLHDREPPSVSVVATTVPVTTAGSVGFAATVTDNKGLYGVQFLIGRFTGSSWINDAPTVQLSPPFGLLRSFGPADNGPWNLQVAARDNNGNLTHVNLPFVVDIAAGPAPDTTPPTVALGVNATVAQVGDSATLSATAIDDVGVTKVEFYKGATLLGERTVAPYALTTVAFTNADVGTPQVFTAKAYDDAGNNASSAPVTVTVSAVVSGDVYVNAASGSDAAAGSAGAPFKTLAKAFSVVGSGATVWLQNGAFTTATEGTDMFTGRTVPAGGKLRAVNPGGASIGFALKFAGSGSVIDAAFDMSANGTVSATTGDVLVSRPSWVKLGAAGTGDAIVASGSAKVAVDNGGQAGHAYFAAAGIARLATLSGSAELAVNGGAVDRLSGGGAGYMLGLGDDAKLTLNSVTWTNASGAVVAPTAIDVNGSGGSVTLLNSSIDLTGAVDQNNGGNACVRLRGPAITTTLLTLDGATLKACPGDAIQVRDGTPTIVIQNNSAIQSAGFHGLRSAIFGNGVAAPAITVANSSFSSNGRSAIELLGGGTLGVTGSAVVFNGAVLPNGGVRLLGAHPYTLTMRNSIVQNNIGDAGSGGIVLQGNAASSFDLGTKVSPGANNIKFHGAGTTNLRVGVAAGVQVLAVGNTWTASTQSTDNLGRYNAASNPCGTNPCVVSSGSGQNYTVTGGSLRLVDD